MTYQVIFIIHLINFTSLLQLTFTARGRMLLLIKPTVESWMWSVYCTTVLVWQTGNHSSVYYYWSYRGSHCVTVYVTMGLVIHYTHTYTYKQYAMERKTVFCQTITVLNLAHDCLYWIRESNIWPNCRYFCLTKVWIWMNLAQSFLSRGISFWNWPECDLDESGRNFIEAFEYHRYWSKCTYKLFCSYQHDSHDPISAKQDLKVKCIKIPAQAVQTLVSNHPQYNQFSIEKKDHRWHWILKSLQWRNILRIHASLMKCLQYVKNYMYGFRLCHIKVFKVSES